LHHRPAKPPRPALENGKNPEAGTIEAMITWRLVHPYLLYRIGQEEPMPAVGVKAAMRISADGCIATVVLTNKMTVYMMDLNKTCKLSPTKS